VIKKYKALQSQEQIAGLFFIELMSGAYCIRPQILDFFRPGRMQYAPDESIPYSWRRE